MMPYWLGMKGEVIKKAKKYSALHKAHIPHKAKANWLDELN